MIFSCYRNGELIVRCNELKTVLILSGIVSEKTVCEVFDETYGTVDTPIGEIPMGMLMKRFLSPREFEDFQFEIANDLADVLNYEDWRMTAPFTETLDYGEFSIERYYEENETEKRDELKTKYKDEILRIESVCNEMEGEW